MTLKIPDRSGVNDRQGIFDEEDVCDAKESSVTSLEESMGHA